jgi:MFS family permease
MSKNEGKFTVSEVIDSTGVSKFTWAMFVFLGIAMVFDGYDFMIVNVTNNSVAASFNLDGAAFKGSLTTWSLLGMIAGGALGGILSDKFGRKKTLIAAIAFYSIFTFPQAFAQDYTVFALFRFIAGLGVGSCIPVVTTCFSETMPSKRRGIFITFGMSFMVLGWVLAGLIGGPITNHMAPLIPGFTEELYNSAGEVIGYGNWRITYFIGAVPLVYAAFLLKFMHETPHWYANSGRIEQAVKRLAEIEKAAGRTPVERDPALLAVPPKPEKTSPAVLFSRKYIMATCAIWSTYFIGQFCVYGMNAWLPTWFLSLGYSPTQASSLHTWNNVAAIIANLCVGFVSDRFGRKRNLAFGWLLSIVVIVICSSFVVSGNFGLCLVLMLFFGFSLNYAITAVQPLMPENYPTQIRNMGVSWCQAFARLGGALAPILLGSLSASKTFQTVSAGGEAVSDWSKLVLILIIPLALGFICTLIFVKRETKGKSMDELQEEIEES